LIKAAGQIIRSGLQCSVQCPKAFKQHPALIFAGLNFNQGNQQGGEAFRKPYRVAFQDFFELQPFGHYPQRPVQVIGR